MKTNAMRILDRMHVPFEVHTYEVAEEGWTAESAAELLDLPHEQLFKTLVTRVDPVGVVVACVPGSLELDMKTLAAAADGKRADMVSLKELQPLTGYVKGGCSPFGMKKDFPTYLDRSAEQWPFISVNGGARGCQVYVAPSDLIRVTNATLADITKPKA
jgi:Cys-tRNA(Pro)/Cys-tRNA(Cys) deacylase